MSADTPQTPLPIQPGSAMIPGSYTLPDNSKKVRSSDGDHPRALPVSGSQNFKTLKELPHLSSHLSSNDVSGSGTDVERDLIQEYRMLQIQRTLRRKRRTKSGRSATSSVIMDDKECSQGRAPATPSEVGYPQGTWSTAAAASSTLLGDANATFSKPATAESHSILPGDDTRSDAALTSDHLIGLSTEESHPARGNTATGVTYPAHHLPVPSSPVTLVPISAEMPNIGGGARPIHRKSDITMMLGLTVQTVSMQWPILQANCLSHHMYQCFGPLRRHIHLCHHPRRSESCPTFRTNQKFMSR